MEEGYVDVGCTPVDDQGFEELWLSEKKEGLQNGIHDILLSRDNHYYSEYSTENLETFFNHNGFI